MYKKTVLGIAGVLFVFQQSPLNEIIRVWAATSVLRQTHSPLLTALVVAGLTFVIEAIAAVAIAKAMRLYPSKMSWMHKKLTKKDRTTKRQLRSTKASTATDTALALGIGAGAVLVKKHFEQKNRSAQDDARTIVKSSAGIALFSAIIAYLASGGIESIDKLGMSPETTQLIFNIATDWKIYVIIILAIELFGYVNKKIAEEKN